MKEIVKTFNTQIGICVNLREVHKFLEIKKDFTDWAKNQIQRFRLESGRDFYIEFEGTSGRKRTQYIVNRYYASHIATASETEKGFQLRDYFFECEKNLIKIGEAYKAQENDPNFVPYALFYSKERECIELKRAMNRMTENAQLIFNDPQTHNDTLEFLGYASRAAKTMRQLANDTAEYAKNMERFIASIQKRHGHHKGVNTQCNRLPRHKTIKE